ncbi:acyloxyacyl hydrolase [Fulvivirga lutea]|uniref:Acyloxyacyl hydrolase n=1 Tax=Fulvivirga lutea TaxID=2810512 RepID=A0A975A261_9BACT|nr:acyloxyacyl hydrolase [Fulvivirga lutea]QSE98202.1 acyloxyacyl hydrolase [Fulvivirga lutea]
MKRLLTLIFLLLASYFYTHGQSQWSYGVNPYYGAVLKYKKNMKQLEYTNLHGVELYAAMLTEGSKYWHKLYNYPQWGIAASYFNYNVPGELGEVGSLTTYLDMTAGKKKHKWRLNIGTGIVYSTGRFDSLTNEENKAISSKISYVLRGTIHKEFQLSENYFFNVNIAFRHYSNGKLNMPNNGMNYPIVGVGLRYVPKPFKQKDIEWEAKELDRKVHYSVRGSMSWREVWQEDIKHKAYSLSVYGSKQVSKYNTILVGVDAFNYDQLSVDRANVVYREKEAIPSEQELNNGTGQVAVTVGTELWISKVSVVVQGGIYVYKPQEFYSGWYQRYGIKYNFNKHLFSQISLKSHGRTADMVEFGLGVTL